MKTGLKWDNSKASSVKSFSAKLRDKAYSKLIKCNAYKIAGQQSINKMLT